MMNSDTLKHVGTQLNDVFNAIVDNSYDKLKREENLLKTGFNTFDIMIKGLKKDEIMLVFGKPSMGKTSFLLQCIDNISVKNKKTVLLFSPENSEYYTLSRLLAMNCGISYNKIVKNSYLVEDWLNLNASCGHLSNTEFYIDCSSYIPMSSLTERIANYIDKNNPDVILIDSLDYIGYSETAAQKIKMLKKIACAFKVPIICTCKIPHTLKKTRKNAYMRKAGEYADIVVEIWRELYEERDKSRETYFLTHKNNKGQTGSLYLNFDLDKLVFTEQNE